LGSGFTFEAEAQYVREFAGNDDNTFAFGIGVGHADFPWKDVFPTSLAFYSGPSYSTDPQIIPGSATKLRPESRSKHFLNYVGVELAVGLAALPNWALVGRYFHRSGVFGLITNIDEGSAIGLGIRREF